MPRQKLYTKTSGLKQSKTVGQWQAFMQPLQYCVGLASCIINLGGTFRLRIQATLYRRANADQHTHSA